MFARENGCEWDTRVCEYAARGGHLELIKWARAHDAPWDINASHAAYSNQHQEVLAWILDHGCPNFQEDEGGFYAEMASPSPSVVFSEPSEEEDDDDEATSGLGSSEESEG